MSSDGKAAPTDKPEGAAEDSLAGDVGENASTASSLTKCKHDLENCEDPESSINKDYEECNAGREEQPDSSGDGVCSNVMRNVKASTRYFIIKSLSHQNIQLSVEKGIWATQVMNEPILEEAFHNSDKVILLFSVNMSGFFQGYAQMMSSVGWRRDNVWSKSTGGTNPWGRTFEIKWLRLCDLPFQKTLHLKNPLNDYKPVKISRDCQELPADVGEALCALFDGEVDMKGKLKRNNSCMNDILVKGDVSLRRPLRNSPIHSEDENCMFTLPSSHMGWAAETVFHPSLLHQHVPHKEHTHKPFVQRSPSNRQGSMKKFPYSNKKDAANGRNLALPFSDEDILDMTYEEYLQAVGSSYMPPHHLASVGTTWDPSSYTGR